MSYYDLKGKRILVTGGSRGIGREIVKELVNLQADVYALGKNQNNLGELKKEYPSVNTVCCDLTDYEDIKKKVTILPAMDGLVNNAGVNILSSFLELNIEHFDVIFNTNVKAAIFVSQIVARQMIENKINGSIVNLSSQASFRGLQDHTLYCGSKGALDAVTRSMALELADFGIRVNSVNPTVVMTELGKEAWSEPKKKSTMLQRIPLNRFAETHEVVDSVFFLLSSRSGMCNGVTLPVDGGFLVS